MKVKQFIFNPFQENTYLLINDSNECILIDPGCLFEDEQQQLAHYIKDNQLSLKRIINTHLHLDHVFGNAFLRREFGISAEAHQADEFLLEKLPDAGKRFGIDIKLESAPLGGYLNDGDSIVLGDIQLKVMHVPGHSPGGLVFYAEKDNVLFSGDVLFYGSIGRTDLEKGNLDDLLDGIKTKLFTLPDETVVFCGHGTKTSIEFERKSNPFIV